MDSEKRKSGRSMKKINDNDRSESNSPSFMDYDEEEEDLGPRRGGRVKGTISALSKLQAKEDANSLFMSNFDPSVSRKAKLKDKTYKDQNLPGNISGTPKNAKKESLYDGKGILLLVWLIVNPDYIYFVSYTGTLVRVFVSSLMICKSLV